MLESFYFCPVFALSSQILNQQSKIQVQDYLFPALEQLDLWKVVYVMP